MKKSTSYGGVKAIAWLFLTVFILNIVLPVMLPVTAYAGGPTQPEVQGFTPVGVSDMVDPFTGDFMYNLPLMDVEGYPINIAYRSGISMDQEASWVGLGWNLNMGAVVRSMRGLPDDFNGDVIVKTTSTKPNINVGLDFGASLELFSIEALGLNVGAGIDYNNYRGFATSLSVSPSYKFAGQGGMSGTAGFSLSGSSENGSSFSPSFSLDTKMKSTMSKDNVLTQTIGASVNSRAGLQEVSYSAKQREDHYKLNFSLKDFLGGGSGMSRGGAEGSKGLGGVGGSFDVGLHTYTPGSSSNMRGISFTGNVTLGGSVFSVDPSFNIGINFSSNWIPDELKTINSPAYGYFNLANGQKNAAALLDFNRDNDGSFTKYSVNLPTAYLTHDVFSIEAQGTAGSFRAFRNDVGYVRDARTTNMNAASSLSLEFGLGNLLDFGGNIKFNVTNSWNGGWENLNDAAKEVKFEHESTGLLGDYAIQEANESSVDRDGLMNNQFKGKNPVYMPLGGGMIVFSKLQKEVRENAGGNQSISTNNRTDRIKANDQLYFLTHKELADGLGIAPINGSIYTGAKNHHIGEITKLGTDGRRYVFGIAAYNHFQEDVTFAMGGGISGSGPTVNDFGGLIDYSASDASTDNSKGIDRYYSSSKTPAYAHSFMLTTVLSDDYTDSDGTPGPTPNDMGSYVNFEYMKVAAHQWRTPIEASKAYYDEGLKTDPSDDKGSFVHGEKDLWYVKAIETKNYVAVFVVEDRKDGRSVSGRDGGLDGDDSKAMKCLKKISLYSKPDYIAHQSDLTQATPLQEVHFEYSYELCPAYPGNIVPGGGKLTLKKIYFTYQGSSKMQRRPYVFKYNGLDNVTGLNPSYDMKAVDRWGTYLPNSASTSDNPLNPTMTNGDFPYTNQNKALTDKYASAWCLSDIILPSGGKISIDYESDDYGYVQHKPASQMFKIVSVGTLSGVSGTPKFQSVSVSGNNRPVYFEMKHPDDDVNDYISVGEQLYFRVLMDFMPTISTSAGTKGKCEYVSGYGTVTSVVKEVVGGIAYGKISMTSEKLKDSGSATYSPMTKAGIQMGRLHMSRYINDALPNNSLDNPGAQQIIDFGNSVVSAIASFGELITGPNIPIYNSGKCQQIVVNKSFIRLREPESTKLGGGVRVRRIRMNDNWSTMTQNADVDNYEYGQEFNYKTIDGKSSGVASYEPQMGGDENPFHTAYIVNNEKRFAPDDQLYIENPIMESQFPSPSVGYSRVEISDIAREGVTRTATGKVVKEFYTARDFPTIVRSTDVDMRTSNKRLPIGPSYHYLDASQGFVIELNDMHGKTKKESVYAQNKTQPLSTVEFIYQSQVLNLGGVDNQRLSNMASIINPDGSKTTAELGVKYDLVADFRQSDTKSIGGTMNLNVNAMLFGFFPIVLPIMFPKADMAHDRFRSASMSKVINRFGILEKTIADQDGSKVETRNLSYDSQTGQVLSTQTTTNFNDNVYSFNYPAYWKYKAFGAAFNNINYKYTIAALNSTGYATIPAQKNLFTEGDEVSVYQAGTSLAPVKAWVAERNATGIRLIDKNGDPVTISNAVVKVIRSGYRNKQGASMGSITSLSNPEDGLLSNTYPKVLNAGAVEFGQDWKTYCECFLSEGAQTTNPFVMGTKGNWRPVRSFTHLSGRTQSNYDNNTDIRRDGVFSSYTPYYKLENGNWGIDGKNWTFVSEVTAFSPNGMTLETRDALGRYSASSFGFNNTLTTAVAANTSMKEMAFGSFEDVDYTNCMDINFFKPTEEITVSNERSHSGKHSVKVAAGNYAEFGNVVSECPDGDPCPAELILSGDFGMLPKGHQYTMTYEVINGDAAPEIINSVLTMNTVAGFEVIVTITNEQGCAWTIHISRAGRLEPIVVEYL